jgi:hypothetical protein
MNLQYVLDEHVPHALQVELIRREPTLVTWRIGEPGCPSLGTLDPQVLEWCEEHAFVLVTNNRRSMPGHLANHLARGRHVPGIFILDPGMSLSAIAEDLILIAVASFEGEHADMIKFLPLSI